MNKSRYPQDYRKELYKHCGNLVFWLLVASLAASLLNALALLLFGVGFLPVAR